MDVKEDEIDLRELFRTIWNNKIKIVSITFITTLLALVYAVTLPNKYSSEATFASTISTDNKNLELIPEELQGYLNINIGSALSPEISYNKLLSSYEFMKIFIKKYKLNEKYSSKNEVYAFGLNLAKEKKILNDENSIFALSQSIKSNLKISKNKKNNLIIFSYSSTDRYFNKIVIDSFVKEASNYLYQKDLSDLNLKISNFKKEMSKTKELILRNSLAELVTVLMQKRVFLKSDRFYGLKTITNAEVAYIKNKTGPKRALIIIVAFITGFILSIFLVFLLEFFRSEKGEELQP